MLKLTARVVVPALLLLSLAGFASPAGAVTLPKVAAMADGWTGFAMRPGKIYMGNGLAPRLAGLKWSQWTASAADAHGTLITPTDPSCHPSYLCRSFTRYPVDVALKDAQTHKGQLYFAKMKWSYRSHKNGIERTVYWKMTGSAWMEG